MDTAILVVWWVGLVGALLATVVILKEVAIVLRALADILRLAQITRDAARGVAANVAPASALGALAGSAEALRAAVARQAGAAASVGRKLAARQGY